MKAHIFSIWDGKNAVSTDGGGGAQPVSLHVVSTHMMTRPVPLHISNSNYDWILFLNYDKLTRYIKIDPKGTKINQMKPRVMNIPPTTLLAPINSEPEIIPLHRMEWMENEWIECKGRERESERWRHFYFNGGISFTWIMFNQIINQLSIHVCYMLMTHNLSSYGTFKWLLWQHTY